MFRFYLFCLSPESFHYINIHSFCEQKGRDDDIGKFIPEIFFIPAFHLPRPLLTERGEDFIAKLPELLRDFYRTR